MTEAVTQAVDHRAVPVTIRPYRPLDHRACRELWAELAEAHREIYRDRTIGGADPGAGFEEHLTRLDLAGMWVADHPDEGVVGLVGLVLGSVVAGGALVTGGPGLTGEVEPIVVAAHLRGHGIGRALLEYLAVQARRRGMRQLSISPLSRNIQAVRRLYAAGYDHLASVTLTMPLVPDRDARSETLDLYGMRFSY